MHIKTIRQKFHRSTKYGITCNSVTFTTISQLSNQLNPVFVHQRPLFFFLYCHYIHTDMAYVLEALWCSGFFCRSKLSGFSKLLSFVLTSELDFVINSFHRYRRNI